MMPICDMYAHTKAIHSMIVFHDFAAVVAMFDNPVPQRTIGRVGIEIQRRFVYYQELHIMMAMLPTIFVNTFNLH